MVYHRDDMILTSDDGTVVVNLDFPAVSSGWYGARGAET